jgi:sarcosine oxidase subunit beta
MATFCNDDGLADPSDFLQGYEKAARRLGVQINLETPVTGLESSAGKISGVVTKNGKINTPLVINCAGAWSAQIAKMAGAELNVLPYRRQCATTGPLDFIRPDIPMVVDVASGLYCHKETQGLLLGWADKSVEPSFDISTHPDYTDTIIEKALDRMPKLETAEIASEWAGLYETTPDHRAIIGWEPTVEGLFHSAGFSGHGLMHAPAAGIVTTEIVTGKKPSIDITDLSPERFTKGAIVHETNVI